MITPKQAAKEIHAAVVHCIKKYRLRGKLGSLTVQIRNVQRGYADTNLNLLVLPLWALTEGRPFLCYYILHEMTHFICDVKYSDPRHGKTFKTVETAVLRDFGLRPVYMKTYIRSLYDAHNRVVFQDR